MGKTSKRHTKKAPRTTTPAVGMLDVIPGWLTVHNCVFIKSDVLAHIQTLDGEARAAFVRHWVGESVWAQVHKAYGMYQERLASGHTEEAALDFDFRF